MIIETVKKKLLDLFPDPAETSQQANESIIVENQHGTAGKDSKKEQATVRQNGVIDCNYAEHGYHLDAQLSSEQLLVAVTLLFESGFFIETITGVDWIKDDQIEAVYDFNRYDFDLCRVVIRVRTPRSKPLLPTITGIYSGANWHEREAHDFFGIVFVGHPHLIPLLLPEDADFHPLLKDFKA